MRSRSRAATKSISATHAKGETLSHDWDFGDGATASGATVTHVYATAGRHHARVKVTAGGAVQERRVEVQVLSGWPRALDLTCLRVRVQPGKAVTIQISGSFEWPDAWEPGGTATLEVGGVALDFVIDGRGRGLPRDREDQGGLRFKPSLRSPVGPRRIGFNASVRGRGWEQVWEEKGVWTVEPSDRLPRMPIVLRFGDERSFSGSRMPEARGPRGRKD